DNASGWDWERTKARLRANWTLASPVGRHAIRYGVALALGVAIYRIAGMREHGYWIPLTILFVLRPERDETDRRLVLRAVGTLAGLALATALAVLLDGAEPWVAIALSLSAALSFGLITVQYALFTAAITTYVVLLSDTLGEARFDAAGQRVIGTAVGILIAWLAFRIYPGPRESRELTGRPARDGRAWDAAVGRRRVEQPHVRDRGRDDQIREARDEGGRLPRL